VAPDGLTQVPTPPPSAPVRLHWSEQQSELEVQMSLDARQVNWGLHAPPWHTPEQQPPPAPASGLHGSPSTPHAVPWPGIAWQVALHRVVQHSVPEVQAAPVALQVEVLQMLLMQLRPEQQSPATWHASPGLLQVGAPQTPLVLPPPPVSQSAPPQHGTEPASVEHPKLWVIQPASGS